MARGNTKTSPKNNASNLNLKKPMDQGKMSSFQGEIKSQLQKLCDTKDQVTILNVAEKFKLLSENMNKIQEAHKKKCGWEQDKDLIPDNTLDERIVKCKNMITDFMKTHEGLENLNNVKVIKEFDGIGLRKTHKSNEFLHDKEKNQIRIPIETMMTCDSVCNSKEFEKFITTDRMTVAMMNVRLALRLAYHRYDKQSQFNTWMDTLPNNYATPLYWEIKDYECLQTGFEACNELALATHKFYTTIARQYLYFLSVFSTIPSLKKFYGCFTWDSYRWAVSTVQTRANQLSKKSLGFIPVLELCNTNLKSDLVIGRVFSDEENQTGTITMAELDISSIGNNKNIYFSYSGNVNNRSSLQSLIHNALCFPEKLEITVHLPQAKPLHQEKVDYMRYVGGDDFNAEACLSPLVKIKNNDDQDTKEFSLKQMINFLVVALDREPTAEEMPKILEARKVTEKFEKTIREAQEVHLKYQKSVMEAKQKKEEIPEKPSDLPKIPATSERPDREFMYDYTRAELRPKAKQFLKIRLSVLKRYLDKIQFDQFSNDVLRTYIETKRNMFEDLIQLVDSV
jgi:hypothetical protein